MTARRCIPWPDARLRSVAADVAEIDDEVRAIWRDMVDTMEAMPGVGLAAVQIGVMRRLAVVDASDDVPFGNESLMPKITQASPGIQHVLGTRAAIDVHQQRILFVGGKVCRL